MADFAELINAGVDMDSLLKRLMNNEALVKVFIKKFTDDKTFENLEAAFKNGDEKQAELSSHTLKGMCGNLSVTVLYDMFSEQTNLIRSGEMKKAEDMMPDITKEYKDTVSKMASWLLKA